MGGGGGGNWQKNTGINWCKFDSKQRKLSPSRNVKSPNHQDANYKQKHGRNMKRGVPSKKVAEKRVHSQPEKKIKTTF